MKAPLDGPLSRAKITTIAALIEILLEVFPKTYPDLSHEMFLKTEIFTFFYI